MTDFGQKLRTKRRNRNMTLKQLSEKTKLSVSMLSEIERGVAQPSMASLKRISQVMGFSFFDFEDDDAYSPRAKGQPVERQAYITDIKVVKAGERKKLMDPKRSPYLYELLTPDFKRMFEVLYLRWEPGFSSGPEPIVDPPGEKFLFVLKGGVEYRLNDKVYRLEEGDSIYYPSGIEVYFRVIGDEPCLAIGVGTPPSF
jgi:transcriptional regulator with XRE-family HTH domain